MAVLGRLRSVALSSTEGTDLDQTVSYSCGQPIVVPVGTVCQGRILNVVGSALDLFYEINPSIGYCSYLYYLLYVTLLVTYDSLVYDFSNSYSDCGISIGTCDYTFSSTRRLHVSPVCYNLYPPNY